MDAGRFAPTSALERPGGPGAPEQPPIAFLALLKRPLAGIEGRP